MGWSRPELRSQFSDLLASFLSLTCFIYKTGVSPSSRDLGTKDKNEVVIVECLTWILRFRQIDA